MSEKPTSKEYISSLKPIWCPGCGDFGVLNAMALALADLGRPTHEVAVISGIGCSSRLPGYLNTYGFNAIHGRALPIACGVKISRPDIEVIVVGGDGDGFSIGGGHVAHAVRRNVNITYCVMDNSIYGLTKGQVSPTTPVGDVTSTTIYGNIDQPVSPLHFMMGYGSSFLAQSTPLDPKHLANMLIQAIRHPGFSFVNILSPCVTYRGKETYQQIKERMFFVDQIEGFDPSDSQKAWNVLSDRNKYPMGVIHKKIAPTYEEKLKMVYEKAGRDKGITLSQTREQFLP